MTYVAPNSVQARDIASIVHPQTNLVQHLELGPMVIGRGDGCRIYDDSGTEYIDAAAGLWCASLGYASERLARVTSSHAPHTSTPFSPATPSQPTAAQIAWARLHGLAWLSHAREDAA